MSAPVGTITEIPETIEPPQHMRALGRANEVRLARASVKRAVATGKLSVVAILEGKTEPKVTECLANMELGELLASQSRWGRARARKLLSGLEIRENKAFGSLTPRQRLLVAEKLSEKVKPAEPVTA